MRRTQLLLRLLVPLVLNVVLLSACGTLPTRQQNAQSRSLAPMAASSVPPLAVQQLPETITPPLAPPHSPHRTPRLFVHLPNPVSLDDPGTVVIRNHDQLQQVVDQSVHEIAPPTIDFADSMIILVAQGFTPSGGYNIQIIGVYEEPTRILVTVRSHAPDISCGVTTSVGWHADWVSVSQTEKPVDFWYEPSAPLQQRCK